MDNNLVEIFSSFEGKEEELIPILQKVQNTIGFLSDESMEEIARFARVPKSKVFGVATFYAQFRFTPKGENHIMLCRGTACHVKGAGLVYDAFRREFKLPDGEETDESGKYTLEKVACLGCCTLAPVVQIDETTYGHVAPDQIEEIIEQLLEDVNTEVPEKSFSQMDRMAKSLAKNLAIKSGVILSFKEQEEIVNKLFMCKQPESSPFGKTTFVTVEINEIDNKFEL